MNKNPIIESIVKGIQEKKGKNIRVADLTQIDEAICSYIVICEGNSPNQVSAISDEVEAEAKKSMGVSPLHVVGQNNCIWVAMDYADVMVHVFLPEAREFYDIDNLWEDAITNDIPNLD